MPTPPGTKFRFKKTKKGYIRLAINKGEVIETTKFKGKKGHLKKVAKSKRCLGKH